MTFKITEKYAKAVEEGLIPGFALLAAKNGETIYSQVGGVRSLSQPGSPPFQTDTLAAIASCTKLITAVLALQVVQEGLIDLDDPEIIARLLPTMTKHGVLEGFDEKTGEPIMKPIEKPITLRMLLTHTSGHEYDLFSPVLLKWRAHRNEEPWAGKTVEEKVTSALTYQPGTSWAYSSSMEWVGLVVERLTGKTLEDVLVERILKPLGISEGEVTFFPKKHPNVMARKADMSTLDEKMAPPAKDMSEFDPVFGATDCLGGGGAYGTAEAYFEFLNAVARRDNKLLNEAPWEEMFRPQLDQRCGDGMHDLIRSSPFNEQVIGIGLPADLRKTWCFAGMLCNEGREGVVSAGTVMWGGAPSLFWFIDPKAEVCGVCFVQILPLMAPAVLALHQEFREEVCGR